MLWCDVSFSFAIITCSIFNPIIVIVVVSSIGGCECHVCSVISVIAGGFPRFFNNGVVAALEGDDNKASEIATLAQPIIEQLFVEGNPGGIKAVLHQRGLVQNQLRLPLVPVSDSVVSKLRTYVDQYD